MYQFTLLQYWQYLFSVVETKVVSYIVFIGISLITSQREIFPNVYLQFTLTLYKLLLPGLYWFLHFSLKLTLSASSMSKAYWVHLTMMMMRMVKTVAQGIYHNPQRQLPPIVKFSCKAGPAPNLPSEAFCHSLHVLQIRYYYYLVLFLWQQRKFVV